MSFFTSKFINKESNDSASVSSVALFTMKEAYKTIRANLLLNLEEKPCHVITITSSLAGEGKSTSAINLAIAIAQFNKKVLVIDADLRKRKASKYLKYSSGKGLSDVLKEEVDFDKAVNVTKYPNLDFLSTGTFTSAPSETLASLAMTHLLEKLETMYEYIIIDTPPVNVVADALPIIKQSEGVVVVARENVVTTDDLDKLLDSLNMIKANIFGIVYIGNDSNQPYNHKYYYGNKYYGEYK